MSKISVDREDYLKHQVLSNPIITGTLCSPRGIHTEIGSPRGVYSGINKQQGVFTGFSSPRAYDISLKSP